MPPNPVLQRRVNGWGARLMPLIILGLVGYSIWIIIAQISVKHILSSHSGATNHAAAIVIIVLYSILLILTLVTYLRLLLEVLLNPGYASFIEPSSSVRSRPRRGHDSAGRATGSLKMTSISKKDIPPSDLESNLRENYRSQTEHTPSSPQPSKVPIFWEYDIFECEADGLPRWCSVCNAYKPDRSHHLSDAGRCVFKLDHFCPWAGGVIGDNTLKFFVQFCVYATFFTGFMLIVLAIYVAKTNTATHFPDVNWIVMLALSSMFFLFALGMSVNCFRLMLQNSTTVDSLSFDTRAYHLAVYIGQGSAPPKLIEPRLSNMSSSQRPSSRSSIIPRTITYPLPADHPASSRATNRPSSSLSPRTFAILTVPHGSNPYKLSKPLSNVKETMGDTIWDWLLPIRRSPSCTRNAITRVYSRNHAPCELTSMYRFGPGLDRMISEAGLKRVIAEAHGSAANERPKRRRSRRRKRSRTEMPSSTTTASSAKPQTVPSGW